MLQRPTRIAFTGPFSANHHARAIDAVCERLDVGARDILYIVATPAARRRAIADLLARRGAVFGVTVKTMSSLSSELHRRAGRAEGTRVDPLVSSVLVERELRIATGNRFGSATPVQGLAATAERTIDFLEQCGAQPAQLEAALEGRTVGEGAHALARVFHGTAARRARLGSSEAEVLDDARELLLESPAALVGLDAIVIESLSLRTKAERDLVAALMACAPCDVTVAHGHVRQLADAPSSRALAWLRSAADWHETTCEPKSSVETVLFSTDPIPLGRPLIPTKLLEASGDVGEVRLAARVVRRHLEAGVRPSEIAIVVHGAATRYRDLIREVFEPAGIAVDATSRKSIAETGIGSVVLELLTLAVHPDRVTREASLSAARSPHIALRSGQRDRLHRHIINEGHLGLDGWDALALEALGDRTVNRVNRLRRAVADARTAFAAVSSPEHAARVVRQLAKELRLVHNAFVARRVIPSEAPKARSRGIETVAVEGRLDRESLDSSTPRALRARSARNDIAIREDNVAWEAIGKALDDTVPAMLGVDRSSAGLTGLAYAAAWLSMLQRALTETPVGAERASANAVQVRSTGPGCEAPARVTIVLGLIEKIFPRQARQDAFLDDDLRLVLRERYGWELPISTDTVDRERECFLRAISSATETLYLSYPATDGDGRPSVRSFFIDDYEAIVGALPVERANTPSAIAQLADAVTRAELLTSLAHDVWQYLPRTPDSADRRANAFRTVEALTRQNANLAPVRHGRRVSPRPKLEGVLPPDAPHVTLTLSASQLKSIGHCTYSHFVDKVLSPETLQPPEYDNLAKGTLIHDAVMQWSTQLDGWNRGEEALDDLVTWYNAQIDKWSPAKRSTERTARATESDLERLIELLGTEIDLLRVPGIAQPVYAELAFGEKMIERGPRHAASRKDAFTLDVTTDLGQRTVSFHGALDRVDVVTIGGTQYGVVVDYKTGKTSKYYAKDMKDGSDLQLRLYLLVLEKFWGITPVGALYLGFGDGVRRGAMRADMYDKFAGVDTDFVDPLPPNDWAQFVNETPDKIARLVNRLVTLDVRPDPRKKDCGFCTLQPVCRYDRWGNESFRAEARSAGVEES